MHQKHNVLVLLKIKPFSSLHFRKFNFLLKKHFLRKICNTNRNRIYFSSLDEEFCVK